jgi:membrane protein
MLTKSEDSPGSPALAAPSRKIGLKGWARVLARAAQRVFPDQYGLIAAGVAFYALLAVFPAIAALMALAGLFTDPDTVVGQLQSVVAFLPDQAALILLNQAQLVAGSSDNGLSLTLALGVGFAVYLSTRGTTSLIHGLNIAYETRETRGVVRFWGTVIFLTLALLSGILVLLLLLIGLPAALAFLPLDFGTAQLIRVLRWGLIAAIVVVGLAVLYRWGPARRLARRRFVTSGAVLAGALWFAGSQGFAIYAANFGNYNQTFGSLGGVIVLLTWLWLSAFVVMLGALLDSEIARGRAMNADKTPAD